MGLWALSILIKEPQHLNHLIYCSGCLLLHNKPPSAHWFQTTTISLLSLVISIGQEFRQSSSGWFHMVLAEVTQEVIVSWRLRIQHHTWLYNISGALEWMKNVFLFPSLSLSLSPCGSFYVATQHGLFYMCINPTHPADLMVYEVSVANKNMVLSLWHPCYRWNTVQKFGILEKSYALSILIFL